MRFSLFILTFIFLLGKCFKGVSQIQNIRIDPAQALGGNVSEYFSDIKYISLETKKESLVGKVDEIIVTDSSLVIRDILAHTVFFFELDGRFIRKIQLKAGILPIVSKADNNDGKLFILAADRFSGKVTIHICSQKGIITTSIEATRKDFQRLIAYNIGDGYLVGFNTCSMNLNLQNLITIYKDDEIYKSLLSINSNDNLLFCGLLESLKSISGGELPGIAYTALPIKHIIYQITKDTVLPLYKVIFPANRSLRENVSATTNRNVIDSMKRTEWWDATSIIQLENIYLTKKLLYFKAGTQKTYETFSTEANYLHNFFYYFKTGKLVALERIMPDESNSYLPLFGNNFSGKGLQFQKSFFCSSITAQELISHTKKHGKKNIKYPTNLLDFFKKSNKNANPVIVLLKLKN